MRVKDYKELDVWKQGIEIVEDTYKITTEYPKDELYGLVSQLRRASVSIPTNVAEGFMRQSPKEYIQFLYVALGSCAEIETLVIISVKCRYLENNIAESYLKKLNVEMKMLSNLVKRVKQLVSQKN